MCKVTDFGLAKQRTDGTYVSGVSSQRGTLPWTAPEVIRTPGRVTEKVRREAGLGRLISTNPWLWRHPFCQ